MRRREFITLLGTAAVGWPLAARAQQRTLPVVGYLYTGTRALMLGLPGFTRGLREAGFVDGSTVVVDYRLADGDNDRLAALAGELVERGVAAIFACDNAAAVAAKAATRSIPIVFWVGGDPVEMKLVASLARPGGNVTGVSSLADALVAKKIELLHDLLPAARDVALLVNPANPGTAGDTADATEACRARGLELFVASAGNEREIDAAFAMLAGRGAKALIVQGDPFFNRQVDQLIALSRRHSVATIYFQRKHVEAGGLMSYGADIIEGYRAAAVYVGRILKGEKPAELPVQQATKLELAISRRTATALGVDIPPSLLVRADEVIE